jgi:hypothetical protein
MINGQEVVISILIMGIIIWAVYMTAVVCDTNSTVNQMLEEQHNQHCPQRDQKKDAK